MNILKRYIIKRKLKAKVEKIEKLHLMLYTLYEDSIISREVYDFILFLAYKNALIKYMDTLPDNKFETLVSTLKSIMEEVDKDFWLSNFNNWKNKPFWIKLNNLWFDNNRNNRFQIWVNDTYAWSSYKRLYIKRYNNI